MARKVIFHIGAPKTGTTFLQTVLWANRDVLRRQGICYPGNNLMDHYHASSNIRGKADSRVPSAADAWKRLLQEVERWPHTALISHEFFGMADADQAAAALAQLAPAEVHLVFTARDYARQFPAMWQQALKMGIGDTFDDFMDKALRFELSGAWSWRTQDLPRILADWGKTLPADHVHVVTVPPSGAPRHLLWQRWCTAVDLDPDSCDLDVAVPNDSLGTAQAEFLRHVVGHLQGPLHRDGRERHRWLRGYLAQDVLVPQGGERISIGVDQRARLAELGRTAVEFIRAEGYDVVGDLGDLLVDEQGALSGRQPSGVGDDELVTVAAAAAEHMVRDVRRLTRERNRWRARARAAERAQTGIWQQAAATARTRVLDAARAVRQRLG